jgi:hypothetical protein
MQADHLEMVVQQDGRLTLNNLPLKAGVAIEVIPRVQPVAAPSSDRYPLRGRAVIDLHPMEPVAESEWGAMR